MKFKWRKIQKKLQESVLTPRGECFMNYLKCRLNEELTEDDKIEAYEDIINMASEKFNMPKLSAASFLYNLFQETTK